MVVWRSGADQRKGLDTIPEAMKQRAAKLSHEELARLLRILNQDPDGFNALGWLYSLEVLDSSKLELPFANLMTQGCNESFLELIVGRALRHSLSSVWRRAIAEKVSDPSMLSLATNSKPLAESLAAILERGHNRVGMQLPLCIWGRQ